MTEYAMDARTKTNRAMESVGAREMTKMANHSMLYSVCGGGGGIMLLCLWVQER